MLPNFRQLTTLPNDDRKETSLMYEAEYEAAFAEVDRLYPVDQVPALNWIAREQIQVAQKAGQPVPHEFRPIRSSTSRTPAPTAETRDRFDLERAVRNSAAKLIEQGHTVELAELNARRAIAYERNEPFVATQADVNAMTAAEVKEYVANGGELPDDDPADVNPFSRDLSDDEVAEALAEQDARLQGGVLARKARHAIDERRADHAKWLVREHGYTPEQADASTSKLPDSLFQPQPTPTAEQRRAQRVAEAVAESQS